MSLEGKASLKVKEAVMNANGMSNLTEMWNALDQKVAEIARKFDVIAKGKH